MKSEPDTAWPDNRCETVDRAISHEHAAESGHYTARLSLLHSVRIGLTDLLLPAGFGAAAALGFAPFGYYALTWLAMTGLLGLWWRAGPRRAAWRGFVFGWGLFGAGVHWPFVSIHEYNNVPLPLAVVLVCLLVVYLSLYPALAGAFAGATRRLPRTLWALVFVPGAWLLTELLRGSGPLGFPWLSVGYTLTDAPVAGLVPLGGVYFVGALLVAAAGALVLLLAGSFTGRVASVVLIVVTPLMLWLVPAPVTWTHPVGQQLSVAIIQGNFPQDTKWDPGYFKQTLARYRRLTRMTAAELVIWPEVAIPAVAGNVRNYLRSIDQLARSRDQTVLVGTLTQAEGGRYYNTVLALGAGSGRYRKRHLVPFGEYSPLPDFARQWLDIIHMNYGGLARGSLQQQPIRASGTNLGVSICFEDAFGAELAREFPDAGIMVNVTNDAWFAGTVAAAQHLNISRMRALEAGRVMLRAANTGISAVIGPAGRVTKRTNQFEVASIEASVQPRGGITPYVRYGDWPLWAAGLIVIVWSLVWAWRRRGSI